MSSIVGLGLAAVLAVSTGPPKIGRGPVLVEGELDPAWQSKFDDAVRVGMGDAGLDETLLPDDAAACSDQACLRSAASRVGLEYLVTTDVVVLDGAYQLELEIVDVQSGQTVARVSDTCELCGLVEVGDALRRQASSLRDKLERLDKQPPTVSVTSTPSGATVRVDGTALGETPLDVELTPGVHQVEVQKAGYNVVRREVALVSGVDELLTLTLNPAPESRSPSALPIVGWTLTGVGVAALATGATFAALAGRPVRTRCSGSDQDADGDCRQLYSTRSHGIGFLSAGAAMLASGAAILIVDRLRRNEKPRRVALEIGGLRW